jgi:aryl-alcohol dehydrogenase-like predicted oxidoreductase
VNKKRLGTSELRVSELAFGCWAVGGGANWGPQEDKDSIEAVQTALDVGMAFFDTAEAYGGGASEQILAKGLGSRRDEAFIASKVSGRHAEPALLREACERSLEHLNTDRIDLYQIHWYPEKYPVSDAIGMLEKLTQEGKIRSYGVCNFGPLQLAEYLAAGGAATTNQVAYSLLFRAIEAEVKPVTENAGMGILAYSPIVQGLLGGKIRTLDDVPEPRQRIRHYSSTHGNARHGEEGHEELTFETIRRIRSICEQINRPMNELALRWLLDRGCVTSVLIGARNGDQVRRNAAAASDPLNEDILRALDEATAELKEAMGPNADLWMKESRIR